MTGWEALVVLALVVVMAALAGRYGVDTRPGGDRPPEAWWPGRR
jgi:hypothetical protein